MSFKYKALTLGGILVAIAVLTVSTGTAYALAGPHHYTNTETGDVYLGGDYIELGISKVGSFGTTCGLELPAGFYGTGFGPGLCDGGSVGMSTNPTGFGIDPDLRMDYFLPGSPEERWAVGYKIDDVPTTGSNNLLYPLPVDPECEDGPDCEEAPVIDITDNTVVDQTVGNLLKATSVGTLANTLKTTQEISFDKGDKYFKNVVTLKNDGDTAIDSVRYMRSFDPDNTVYQGGDFTTHNYIPYTHQAGDGKAVVVADTNLGGDYTDPVKEINGSYSPILFYSNDTRARVSSFGFANTDPYDPLAYDEALSKGTETIEDQAITITFDVGTLAPGASQTFTYYTSLDNRDFSDSVNIIDNTDDDNVSMPVEDNAPNDGDGNNDATRDGVQNNVTSLLGLDGVHYITLESDCANNTNVHVDAETTSGGDVAYRYPAGLLSFRLTGCTEGGDAHITMYYYGDFEADSFDMRKWSGSSYATIPDAVFTKTTINDQKVMKIEYTITDGGPFDLDGVVDGSITDPSGPGTTNLGAPNTGLGRLF